MRTPEENSIIIIASLVSDISKRSWSSLMKLFSGDPIEGGGMSFSLIHHILFLGPRRFRISPTALSLGRGIVSPLVLLLQKKKGSQKS